jgi:hypothetical protein
MQTLNKKKPPEGGSDPIWRHFRLVLFSKMFSYFLPVHYTPESL